ncbi:unnamed protein product [Pylaiella littoralis]
MPSNTKRGQNGAAEAQAQKERQEQVTETQSLTLVKNLIRVSISTVCHLRNIFPSSCFQERTYAGMKIYQLDSATRDADTNETIVKDAEAYDLTMWLESGVFEAVELKYLRRMEFIIMSPEHANPREAYSFDLTYPEDPRDGAVIFSGTKVTTVASTKGQLVKLIRSLIAFGNTLGELPRERILNIKLWYFDDRTPEGWQPKHFREADPSELKFSKGSEDEEIEDKLKIKIGDLATPHHTLSLRFTGYDQHEQQQQQQQQDQGHEAAARDGNTNSVSGDSSDNSSDGEMSQHENRWSKQGSLLTCKAGPEEESENDDTDVDGDDHRDDEDEEDDDDEQTEAPAAAAIAKRDVSRMVSGMMTNLDVSSKGDARDNDNADGYEVRASERTDYAAAKAWAITKTRPTHTGLMAHMEITRELAREFLERMVDEGLFVKKNFKYNRVDQPQPSRVAQPEPPRKDQGFSDSGAGMDVAPDTGTDNHGGGGAGGAGNNDNNETFSSKADSVSDGSETQAPEVSTGSHRHQVPDQRNHTPSSMPPPAAPGRRHGGGRGGGCTPEDSSTQRSCSNESYATPPIPKPSARAGLKPIPEKPQRAKMVTMGTKRVLDESVFSDHDDAGGDDDDGSKANSNGTRDALRGDEPIDVFNPEDDEMGSETGYERMILSQASTTSSTGRPRRKCSLATNPIHQFVQSKRLRVDRRQGRE